MHRNHTFLFSIDLEDVRTLIPDGDQYAERVPAMTHQYLQWLERHDARCTFFVVGETAARYPDLIKRIVAAGHEVGCHTYEHTPLTELDATSFRADTQRTIDELIACGAPRPTGFRAPTFSLTARTSWAHDVLAELGFTYSSSVLPAPNPLFGWPEFGPEPRRLDSGLVEIPMTIGRVGPLAVPPGGGVYFRALPHILVRRARTTMPPNRPLLGYFHPYDIDVEQERFMHPGIDGSHIYNSLMYRGRSEVFHRLDRLMAEGYTITTYQQYLDSERNLHDV